MSRPRLLVSIYNPEEVRASVAGGADIIDCEDPRVVMGMYEPHTITAIAHAVRQSEGQRRLPMSVNIGAELTLYQPAGAPRADSETRARAAQQALGMAAAMDVGDGRPNIIKFGVGGVKRSRIRDLVAAVKRAIYSHARYQSHLAIAGFMPFDWETWEARRNLPDVIRELVRVGEYRVLGDGPLVFRDHFSTAELAELGVAGDQRFGLTEPPQPRSLDMPEDDPVQRMQAYIDEIQAGGADGVLMDTPVHAKVARICLVDHPRNAEETSGGTKPALHGIFDLDALQKYASYCAFHGMESWTAGSIAPFHAEELGKLQDLDVVLCRGAASEPVTNPFGAGGESTRMGNRVTARRVAAMARAVKG